MTTNAERAASCVRHNIHHESLATSIEMALHRKDLEWQDRIEDKNELIAKLYAQINELVMLNAKLVARQCGDSPYTYCRQSGSDGFVRCKEA